MSTTTQARATISRPTTIADNITLTGNLTRDPVVRQTKAGQYVLGTALAMSDNVRQSDGTYASTEPVFVEVVVWGPQVLPGISPIKGSLIANLEQSVAKGDRVGFTGRLTQRDWSRPDPETGEVRKGRNLEFVARDAMTSMRFVEAHLYSAPQEPVQVEDPPTEDL